MWKIESIDGEYSRECEQRPVWVSGAWECGDFRIADENGDAFQVIAPPDVPPVLDRRITRLAFRKRFLKAEKENIEMAALDDPAADINLRRRAAALRANMKDADSALHVDLSREDTREDVTALEVVGLIGVGRALEILDAEIQEYERPPVTA